MSLFGSLMGDMEDDPFFGYVQPAVSKNSP